METGTKVLGVWDDHDYGVGNGDRDFAGKEVFKKLYLNFIDEPAESERRQEGRGLYQDYIITTPEGLRV
jgi:alkaline phosphatase D